jgi:hypothetical protein
MEATSKRLFCALAVLLGLLASGIGAADQRSPVLRIESEAKYVLLGSWQDGQKDGYVILSNSVTKERSFCVYDGQGVFVARSGGDFIETKREPRRAIVFTSDRCPAIGGSFALVDGKVPDLWRTACKASAEDCHLFANSRLSMLDIRDADGIVRAWYGPDIFLVVRKKEGHYVASGLPIPR